jgi:DNA invertase Pin-like site-specific DNA recombinase
MKRAVLYARVSTDAQQKEGTIESQVLELKRQVAAAGDVLVKEYIDDGYSGSLLDRPGLEALRRDVRTPLFDAVYFLDTDRIARDVAYQTIILGELLKYGKQIIIKGRDYVNNPENKFTVTVLGAVAELERAKIIERTTRGRLHRLRMGELSSNGHRIYGYDYVRKTATAPAALVINEEQAPVVRSIFEMFASGRFGLVTISRFLEERCIPTRTGRTQWHRDSIKFMLKNETYVGTRYFNRITRAPEASRESVQVIHGRWVYRDRAEWIPVKVPAIVSRELFEIVHERLRLHEERYCQPVTHYLLQGLVQCGVCGSRCSSSRGYHKVVRPSGRVCVYHRAAYRCNRRARENMHDRTRIERCRNAEIGTHILEGQVFQMIRETMLDPGKLRGCIDTGGRLDDQSIAGELARIAGEIRALDGERRRLINQYAVEEMTGEAYITANRALDRDLERLTREKAELAAALRSPLHEDFVDASVRQFCASARARLEACADFDAKRQFLMEHVERVIFNRYKVTVTGSVPVQSASGETKLQFRIEGEIDGKAVRRSRSTLYFSQEGSRHVWDRQQRLTLAASTPPTQPQAPPLPACRTERRRPYRADDRLRTTT